MRSFEFLIPGFVSLQLVIAGLFASEERPNILLILSDDIGYSDIGSFGGDADTPVLDRLAKDGIRFTQFYNGARCMPTRASLLTGLHPHQAGIGYMGEDWGVDEYSGHLLERCVTISEVLQSAGYHTSQLGKWHVGNRKKNVMPYTRGFDRSWVRTGRVHYFDSTIYELDGRHWKSEDPESFYSTEEMDRKAIEFIDDAQEEGKPFFMYAAYDAAHWPLHAKPEDIAKYRGRFLKNGWNGVRESRYQRLVESGIIDRDWPLPPRDEVIPDWDTIEDKDHWDLKMAIYCAQIDAMDRSIGRIVARLEELGIADSTVILYLQDNGACPEGIGLRGKKSTIDPGPTESYMSYHLPWANVSNTPFQQYKHFTAEGGIATPLIAYWPEGITVPGSIYPEMGHVVDIMSTCVELSGAKYPSNHDGNKILPMEGKSLVPVFKNKIRDGHETFFWEHEGNRAVRKGNWKLVSRYKNDVEYYERWGYPKAERSKEWELFDMEADRTELNDLSDEFPAIVEELEILYAEWAMRTGVRPFEQVSSNN